MGLPISSCPPGNTNTEKLSDNAIAGVPILKRLQEMTSLFTQIYWGKELDLNEEANEQVGLTTCSPTQREIISLE